MTERSLLIRCTQAGRYLAVGMDFPSARVFDVATGNLAAVVNVPAQNRFSLAVVSLTSLSLGIVNERMEQQQSTRKRGKEGRKTDCTLYTTFAAVGLSNGTLLLHNVGKDELVGHLCVSDTQQAVVATAFTGHFLLCVTADRLLHVVDCIRGERIVTNLRVQHDASAIAAVEDVVTSAGRDDFIPESVFCIFISGPTNALYRLRIGNNATSGDVGGVHSAVAASLDRLITFASHTSRTDIAWMGGTPQQPVVITSNAQEGAVRVWDARPSLDGSTATSRCRRSLMCGQRIIGISVREGASSGDDRGLDGMNDLPSAANNGAKGEGDIGRMSDGGALVVVTTFTGTVLVWMLGRSLLVAVAEPMPRPPTFQLTSQDESGRLLFASLLPGANAADGSSSSACSSLLLLRGRFAVPQFEVLDLCDAMSKAVKLKGSAAARRRTALVAGGGEVAVYFVPSDTQSKASADLVAYNDLETLDNAWATHDQQQQRRILLAARATRAGTEGFVPAVSYHAKSVSELPQKSLTLEQRLKQLHVSESNESTAGQQQQQHALGLATVPLYQALHANDTSAVMELLTVASRSSGDIRATVMSLQLPYCLQLLQLLGQRVRGASPCSPLFQWIDAIIRYRGVEMYQVQQDLKQKSAVSSSDGATKGIKPDQPSPPKDFVAPLLHQYRNMVSLYDQIAVMYGRLSIFKSVFPSERNVSANSHGDIIFPKMFVEKKYSGGLYSTATTERKVDSLSSKRRKSRKDGNKKKGARPSSKSKRKAKKGAAASKENEEEDNDMDSDEELDLDALDQMVLSDGDVNEEDDVDDNNSGTDDEEEGNSEVSDEEEEGDEDATEDDEEDEGDAIHKKKRARGEQTTAMVAESERGSSYGMESRHSGEEDFDSGSDEEVGVAAAPSDGSDDEESADDSESDSTSSGRSGADDIPDGNFDDDDDEDDLDEEDDGIGSDVAELLNNGRNGDDESDDEERHELRRYKRAKADG